MVGPSQQAVALVQRNLPGALQVDGILGPKTYAAIDAQYGTGASFRVVLAEISYRRTGRELNPVQALDTRGDPAWWAFFGPPPDGAAVSTHNTQPVSGPFIPEGVMIHHTGVEGREKLPPEKLIEGRPRLSGPLAQVAIGGDLVVHFLANGRAHHAGAGHSGALDRVRHEETPFLATGDDDTYGNTHFFGIEIDGLNSFSGRQLDLAADVAAMWCQMFRWDAARVIGHKEWTKRKRDPAFDMVGFRARVAARLQKSQPVEQTLEQRVAALEKKVAYLQRST